MIRSIAEIDALAALDDIALLVYDRDEAPEAFNKLIGAIEGVGKSLEDTKRLRYEMLHDLAKADKLSGHQILEAMRIISEIERREGIDWTKVFKRIVQAPGGSILFVVGGLLVATALAARAGGDKNLLNRAD